MKNLVNKVNHALSKAIGYVGYKAVALVAFLLVSIGPTSAKVLDSVLNEVKTEFDQGLEPVQSLCYIIAAIIAVLGAFNIFFKMQNGDQDVKKTILLVIGSSAGFVILASQLPKLLQKGG